MYKLLIELWYVLFILVGIWNVFLKYVKNIIKASYWAFPFRIKEPSPNISTCKRKLWYAYSADTCLISLLSTFQICWIENKCWCMNVENVRLDVRWTNAVFSHRISLEIKERGISLDTDDYHARDFNDIWNHRHAQTFADWSTRDEQNRILNRHE